MGNFDLRVFSSILSSVYSCTIVPSQWEYGLNFVSFYNIIVKYNIYLLRRSKHPSILTDGCGFDRKEAALSFK